MPVCSVSSSFSCLYNKAFLTIFISYEILNFMLTLRLIHVYLCHIYYSMNISFLQAGIEIGSDRLHPELEVRAMSQLQSVEVPLHSYVY